MRNIVNSIDTLDSLLKRVKSAQIEYSKYTQEQVDKIFEKVSFTLLKHSKELAEMAVEETKMGVLEDKIIKNDFACKNIYDKYKDLKTCGIVEENLSNGYAKIAEPVGIIACIVPTTNPTSTAIFKCLIALKTRNAVVFSPHPRAKKSTVKVLEIVSDVLKSMNVPADLVGWIDEPSVELSIALMNHQDINLILATGGPAMVKSAYSSGKPAIGVGAGNASVLIDETANIKNAVKSILTSKTFDNGMICATEQTCVIVESIYEETKKEFESNGFYFLNQEDAKKVIDFAFPDKKLSPISVGQTAVEIARLSKIEVPSNVKVLVGVAQEINWNECWGREKLSTILGVYKARDFNDGVEKVYNLVNLGGAGHTSVLHTKKDNIDRIKYFSTTMNTARILINTPSALGAVGFYPNSNIDPSMTLGCGTWGGNSVSVNITPMHLINTKIVANCTNE